MLDELKRYNTVGDVSGMAYFAKVVLSDDRIQKTAAQKICSLQNNIRLNFNAAVAFFSYLGLIEQTGPWLYATEAGKLLRTQVDTPSFGVNICTLCFEKIIAEGVIDSEAIHFSVIQERYYIERYGFSVSAAIFRNILLQHKALTEVDGKLLINHSFEALFEKQQKKANRTKTLEKLKEELENQELQGARAELFVLEYEKRRLGSAALSEKVKQISTIDVSAGYDIVSFAGPGSTSYDRFIEVKSYQGGVHFYWSENEIATAKLHGDKYYLALVDDSKLSVPGYAPLFIRNPAGEILETDAWILTPTSYLIVPTDTTPFDFL